MQARRLHHNGPERCEAGSPGLLAGRKVTRSVAPLGRRSSPVCESRPNRHCLFQAAHRSGRRGSDRSRHPQSMARPTRKPMAFPHRTDLGKRRAPVRFGPPRTACSKEWHTVSGPAAERGTRASMLEEQGGLTKCVANETPSPVGRADRGRTWRGKAVRLATKTSAPAGQAGEGRFDELSCRGSIRSLRPSSKLPLRPHRCPCLTRATVV